jgi:hypothetical protein
MPFGVSLKECFSNFLRDFFFFTDLVGRSNGWLNTVAHMIRLISTLLGNNNTINSANPRDPNCYYVCVDLEEDQHIIVSLGSITIRNVQYDLSVGHSLYE